MKDEGSIHNDKIDQLAFRVAYLIAGFLEQNLTEAEEAELDDWVGASMENQRLFEDMTDPDNLDKWIKWKERLPAAETLSRLQNKLEFSDTPKKKSVLRSIWPYVAAAVLIVGVAVAIKWIPGKNKPSNNVQNIAKDIAPGSNRATLTLAGGQTIVLDSTANTNLTRQGATNINVTDGMLVTHTDPSQMTGEEKMNIVTTPLGGTYSLILPDGSKVILNAGSSLQFPSAFAGKKRSVVLTGEGYFEVAKDLMFPFEVIASGNNITVLGTHFNINSYRDEPLLKVTLEEGSVRLNNSIILKPGEQVQVDQGAAIKVVPADLEKELAWKNGLFIFKQTQLDEVMRQVGRWYNCEVKFEAPVADHFNASVPRNLPVSTLLDFLQGTGRVHFRIEDKKITVLP